MGLLCPGAANDDTYELEEGEWIPDDSHDAIDSSGIVFDEGLRYSLCIQLFIIFTTLRQGLYFY